MRAIVILIDTLRKDFLSTYNKNSWAITPELDNFSKDSLTFDNHYIGSAPCMPARRDIFTGRLNFLERSWGPIEPIDITFPKLLQKNDVFTHITTDHCHYMRLAGDGYLQQFNTWDYHRGQEGDPWISSIDDPDFMPENWYGKLRKQYQLNRETWGQNEKLYPTTKTFKSAEEWLERNKQKDDFFLMVEVFDPHEPFDVPDEYMELYNDIYEGPYFETPNYSEVDVPEEALEYIRNRYAALLTMTDKHFGQLIEKLKKLNMYDDTLIVVTSDHGYFLGERELFGKNYMHSYNEIAEIPLFVKDPKNLRRGQREQTVTQNIDIMPTLLDYYGLEIPTDVRGKSWYDVIHTSSAEEKYAIYGVHGSTVSIADGEYTFLKSPNEKNQPLNEYTTSLSTIREYLGQENPQSIEVDRYFDRTDYPIFKVPIDQPGITKGLGDVSKYIKDDKLFNILEDPEQLNNIEDENLREKYKEKLVELLEYHDAPEDQYWRLGLQDYREKQIDN